MRCPACGVENSDGATVCTSCGKDLTPVAAQTAVATTTKPEAPALRLRSRPLSKMALFGLILGVLAPFLQVLADGPWIAVKPGAHGAAQNYVIIMALTYGGTLCLFLAIIFGLLTLSQVAKRTVRGGALAVGAFLLGLGGMFGKYYAMLMPSEAARIIATMGEQGYYVWQTTVIVAAAAIVCEIVLAFATGPAPAAN